jgi:xanthine dehydrogenase molybdopterin-binding subunit B
MVDKKFQQSTFGAHFVEVGLDFYTGVRRVRHMLAVCACGRILNPKTARGQVIGAVTMGVGAALMEELALDTRHGFFVNQLFSRKIATACAGSRENKAARCRILLPCLKQLQAQLNDPDGNNGCGTQRL